MKTLTKAPNAESTRATVRESYGKIALNEGSCGGSSQGCCGSSPVEVIAQQIDYSSAELAALPEGANMGLSCGNPNALAALRPGEVLLDLGRGGGFDVGLAQNPAAYVENARVREALANTGESALPMVIAGEVVIASGRYPKRKELAVGAGLASVTPSFITSAVAELVAIGAAIVSNCEPCLRFHVNEAGKLGVTRADIAGAIAMAAKVKDAPHQSVTRLAAASRRTAVRPSHKAGRRRRLPVVRSKGAP